jgi:ABC-2 type transport system permease protein
VSQYQHRAGRESASPLPGSSVRLPATFREEAVTGRNGVTWSASAHVFAGMAVQALLFLAIDAGIGLLRDRRLGVWKRLRAAPISRFTLLGSKVVSTAVLALVVLAVVFGFGALVFHLRVHGSALGFALVAASSALMVASFGLFVATLGRTEQQSRGYAIPAVLAMVMLGGSWLPAFLMPRWIQTLSLVMPTRWALDGFDAMTWRGLGLTAALLPAGVVLGFAAIFSGLSLARFRWEGDS